MPPESTARTPAAISNSSRAPITSTAAAAPSALNPVAAAVLAGAPIEVESEKGEPATGLGSTPMFSP